MLTKHTRVSNSSPVLNMVSIVVINVDQRYILEPVKVRVEGGKGGFRSILLIRIRGMNLCDVAGRMEAERVRGSLNQSIINQWQYDSICHIE